MVKPVQFPDCQQCNTVQCKQSLLLRHLVYESDWFWYVDYRSARHELYLKTIQCSSLTSSVFRFSDPGSIGLMVDKLIGQFGQQAVNQWIAKGGSEQYPPSTLHVCSKSYFNLTIVYIKEKICTNEIIDIMMI